MVFLLNKVVVVDFGGCFFYFLSYGLVRYVSDGGAIQQALTASHENEWHNILVNLNVS